VGSRKTCFVWYNAPGPFGLAAQHEIAAQGGTVTDTFDDGARLFQRAVLPEEREVQHRDRVKGGVALRATEDDVWVHPYVFRQICSNGAIIARATQTRHIERSEFVSYDAAETELAGAVREAIQDCCSPEAFQTSADAMRSSINASVDMALNVASMFSRLPEEIRSEFFTRILDKFLKSSTHSRFDLMNAVTATARNVTNPEARWRLEELGGAIPFEAATPEHKRSRVLTA
jgi:hypothetical protein